MSLKPNVKNASHQQNIREFTFAFCLFYRNAIFWHMFNFVDIKHVVI